MMTKAQFNEVLKAWLDEHDAGGNYVSYTADDVCGYIVNLDGSFDFERLYNSLVARGGAL